MEWLGLAWAALVGGGGLAWLLRDRPRAAAAAGVSGTIAGSAIGLSAAFDVLLGGAARSATLPWSLPLGSGAVGLDALSAWFLAILLVVASLVAVYGARYLRAEEAHRRTGGTWLAFGILVASMTLVVTARDGLLFLVAWELMAVSSFALVVFDHGKAEVRRAGWIYLVAGQIGTACLLALFLVLDDGSGRLAFGTPAAQAGTTLPFVLALVGFGLKAGLYPLHVWLPEAHASAPSHVSALMSGVLLKMGVYGLVRTLTVLASPPPLAWGLVLAGVGLASGLIGVVSALAQRDLKRLLAYSSVENLGIVSLGLGISLVGQSAGLPAVAWLGMAAALLHVLNHALFKPLLFLGAGAVLQATGTRAIDRLGGLLKRMPRTGLAFLAGAAAVSGLPPFNGFVSEFLLFLAGLAGLGGGAGVRVASLAVLAGLALIGGLAAACFAMVTGIVFLGEPRTPEAAAARDATAPMWGPMWVLAALCLVVGIAPFAVIDLMGPAVTLAARIPAPSGVLEPARFLVPLGIAGGAVIALAALVAGVRRLLGRGRTAGAAPTWDCGYTAGTARMQYTASSFARPLLEDLGGGMETRVDRDGPDGLFPSPGRLKVHTADRVMYRGLAPLFRALARLLSAGRRFQRGRVQEYLLVLLLTLVTLLLLWKGV